MSNSINNVEENIATVEILIKALGTMVLEPQYQSDPNNIGQKVFITSIQKPIIEGDARNEVLNRLLETIEKL